MNNINTDIDKKNKFNFSDFTACIKRKSILLSFISIFCLSILIFSSLLMAENSKVLVVWDGEQESKASGRTLTEPEKDKDKPENIATIEVKPNVGYNKSKGLVFTVNAEKWAGAGWNWFGFSSPDSGTDISKYKNFVFHIKVEAKDKKKIGKLGVRLASPVADGEQLSKTLTIANFNKNVFDGEWNKIVIPIKRIARGSSLDLKKVCEFRIETKSKERKEFIAYIDNISFDNIRHSVPIVSAGEYINVKQNFTPIDLTEVANKSFYDEKAGDDKGGWTDQGDNDFRTFDYTGTIRLRGVDFNIIDPEKNKDKTCLILKGQDKEGYPAKAVIKVNKKCQGIYFLHNAAWAGAEGCRYRIIYEDGQEEVIKLRNGKEIFDWWGGGNSENSMVAWVGSNPVSDEIALNMFAWINNNSEKLIKEIIVETDGDKAFLMLIALTLTENGPYLLDPNETVGIPDNIRDWFPYEGIDLKKLKGSPLDVSFLLDKPAGKHGYLKAKGEKFYFKDGEEARFWGVNINAENNFVDHKTAEKMAERISMMGANLVRHHNMDASFAKPNIFANDKKDTQELDKKALDNFEYLWAELKKKGVYLNLCLNAGRMPGKGDGVKELADIVPGFKIEGEFVPQLIKLQKKYIKQLLTHKNPYTRTTLAEDPAVAMIEIINEDSLFYIKKGGKFSIQSEAYKKIWQALFNKWLVANYKNRANLINRWKEESWDSKGLEKDEDPAKGSVRIPDDFRMYLSSSSQRIKDTYRFIYETQEKYYKEIVEYLRKDLGVKCLIAGSNHWIDDIADLHVNAKLDYVNRHAYWAHPMEPTGWARHKTMLKDSVGGMVGSFANRRIFGKPYVLSEWNGCYPNQYRAEAGFIMSVYSCLHNWNSIQSLFGKSIEEPSELSEFNINNQPVQMALWPVTALMFHRKDVKEAEKGYFIPFTREQAIDPMFNPNREKIAKLGLAAKSGLMFKDIADDPEYSSEEIYNNIKPNMDIVKSTTGEINWDTQKGILKLDTGKSQGFAGFIPMIRISLSDVDFDIKTDFAVIVVNSLTEKSIKDSDKLLITAVSRANMKGMKYNRDRNALAEQGNLPIIIQPVIGDITLKIKNPIKVYKLSLSGERMGEVKVKKNRRGYAFNLSKENKCLHYEVVIAK